MCSMQPIEAQTDVPTKSLLFNSLKVYLNNKNRLQPIIGLGSIIECVKAGTQEMFYLCEVCVCRLGKADMRNHIMGSLHRYNYIKAWHPHLVGGWQEDSDLSRLAWPLMEMATVLEGKEGPGEVQWLEIEEAGYQKMTTHGVKAAATLIEILKDVQGEPERHSPVPLQPPPVQSQRTVLFCQRHRRATPKSLKTSAETDETDALVESEGWLENTPPEPTVLSENGHSLLDRYSESPPLVDSHSVLDRYSETPPLVDSLLDRYSESPPFDSHSVLDRYSETPPLFDSHSVLDQYTETLPLVDSHSILDCYSETPPLVDSLLENYTETTPLFDSHSVLDHYMETTPLFDIQSVLDHYTGTTPLIGLFRVVECRSEDGHTYCFLCHCCRTRSNRQDIVDHLTKSSHLLNYVMEIYPEDVEVMMADMNDDYPLLQSLAKKVEEEEGRGELQVLIPPESLCVQLTGKSYHWCLKGGSLKIKRACSIPPNPRSPQPLFSTMDRHLASIGRSLKMLFNGWGHTDIPKQKKGPSVNKTLNEVKPKNGGMLLSQWPELLTAKKKKKKKKKKVCEPVFNIRVLERTSFRRGYFNNHVYLNQSENLTVPKYGNVYGENNQSGQHGYEEGYGQSFYNGRQNERPQTEWPSPAVCYTQDVSARNEHYDWETSRAQQWHDSTSRSNDDVVSRGGHQMNLDVAQPYYYQQLPHHQSMALRHASVLMGGAGQHGEAWGVSAQSDAAGINDRPYSGHPFAHSGSFAPQPPGPFLHIEQRPLPTYMGVDHWS